MIRSFEYSNVGETYKSAVLPNGLEIRVVEKPGFYSKFAAFSVKYGGSDRNFILEGKRHETPAGIAHFLEHKMFDMPDGSNVFSVMTANSADLNAFTSPGMTCYYFHCTEHFAENLRLLLNLVTTPYFTPETVDKERPIIAQEIRMSLDDPDETLYYNFMKLLYSRHPIRDDIGGTEESIGKIDAELLTLCHRTFYCPGNMVLSVEGDIRAEEVVAIAEEILSGWESRPVPRPDYGGDDGPFPVSPEIRVSGSVSAPQFIIGSKILPPEGDFSRQQLTAKLAVQVLFGRSSSFYSRLYSDGLINRSFGTDVDYVSGTAMVSLSGESHDPDAVLREIGWEIRKLAESGLDRTLFARIKKASIGGALRSFEDFDSVCLSLTEGQFYGFCPFDGPAILDSITASECTSFLLEHFSPERLAVSILNP